jgi:hypothetical protein
LLLCLELGLLLGLLSLLLHCGIKSETRRVGINLR